MIRLFFISLFAASLFLTEPLAAASITLRWTSTGDDGTTGTARQYDIRYSTSPITESNWNSATQVSGEPAPKPAGSREVFEVSGLKPNIAYYFAIKIADERPNWSTLSNVVEKSACGKCIQFAGNVNGSEDGVVDLADLSLLQGYIIGISAAKEVICLDAANCDGSPGGFVDLRDLSFMVAYLFAQGRLAPCQ